MQDFDAQKLIKDLKIDALGAGIPTGAADDFINRTIKSVQKSLKSKKIITDNDLKRLVAQELKKYNADFAYIYKNRDKIV